MGKSHPTQKRLKELFDYRDDGYLLWKEDRSHNVVIGKAAGSPDKQGYTIIGIDNNNYKAHRLVWLYHYGYMPENSLDHINRIKNDNRIENLREVSIQCNNRNCGNRKDNKTGVKGVNWNKKINKWHAQISVSGKKGHIGYWNEFSEAVLARLAVEQCLNWAGCDSSSPSYQYALKHKLIKGGQYDF